MLKSVLIFIVGATASLSTAELLRQAPGAKVYYAHKLEVSQSPLADGGTSITAVKYVNATLAIGDGGISKVDLGPSDKKLDASQVKCLSGILIDAANEAKTDP